MGRIEGQHQYPIKELPVICKKLDCHIIIEALLASLVGLFDRLRFSLDGHIKSAFISLS